MNFFINFETNQHDDVRRKQIISTRLYIILWIISVVILTVYNGLSKDKFNYQISSSSISTIRDYQMKNFDEFTCPCSKTVTPFQTFTSFNFTLHQICSSEFISYDWLEYLYEWTAKNSLHEAILATHFQLLQLFCQSSHQIVSDSITDLSLTEFISINLLTEEQFTAQTISLIEEFKLKTTNIVKDGLSYIVNIALANQLMTIYETNWHFIPDPNRSKAFFTKSKSYSKKNSFFFN